MISTDKITKLFAIAILVAVIGAAFTWIVLSPKFGFDDGNITQAYARNLAQGHGYVYNIGGERVEGSTSLVWTLISAGIFAVAGHPETVLALLSLLLTAGTIFLSMLIARELAGEIPRAQAAPLLTAALFLAFPPFFGWMVWSLMDMVLWIFLITALVFVLVRMDRRQEFTAPGLLVPLAAISALLPVARPEGIALTTAVALYYGLRQILRGDGSGRAGLVVGLGGLVSAGLATLWRLSYFGYPAPNTFYAKTSSHILDQVLQGAWYTRTYITVPQNALFVLACCLGGIVILTRGSAVQRQALWFVTYLIAGGVLIYTGLGGDHFGSHRFFLYFLPLGLPLVALGVPMLVRRAGGASLLIVLVPFAVIGLVATVSFVKNQGAIRNEFAIAEDSRELGGKLNALPGQPAIGVVVAGGIRMTYAGEIQDLMGLNWTLMAHAADDGRTSGIPNHQGFNSIIFWQAPPDVFVPYTGDCPATWQPTRDFLNRVTDRVSETDDFRENYALYCYDGMVLYLTHAYLDRVRAAGGDFPFDKVGQGE